MSFYQGAIGPDKVSHPMDVIAEVHAVDMTIETMQREKIAAKATPIVVRLWQRVPVQMMWRSIWERVASAAIGTERALLVTLR